MTHRTGKPLRGGRGPRPGQRSTYQAFHASYEWLCRRCISPVNIGDLITRDPELTDEWVHAVCPGGPVVPPAPCEHGRNAYACLRCQL